MPVIKDIPQRYLEMRQAPMMEHKPHLLPYLVQLGVLESHAKTFTVARAYDVLYSRLWRKLNRQGKPKGKVTKYFWLWTHGVALDGLQGLTKKQVTTMLEMIWSNQNKSNPQHQTA